MTDISDLRIRPVLPIGTVMQLTELTARQIRYYEQQGLLHPKRTAGNHRMYSLKDVDNLLDIKAQLEAGFTLADVRRLRHPRTNKKENDSEVRRLLEADLFNASSFKQPSEGPRQGFGFRP